MRALNSISRRRFLAFSAGGALSALSARKVCGANDRIRLGLLGCGRDGVELVDALRYSGAQADLVYVWDEDAEKRDAFAARTQSQRLDHWQHLIERRDIDGVMVATSAVWHSAMAAGAMEAGKDVYCVSPMTGNLSDASSFREAAAHTGRVVQIGACRTSDPAWRAAMDGYRSGSIGPARRITVTYHEGKGSTRALQRVYDAIAPVVMATGIGYPEKVTAAGGRYDGDVRDVPDALMLTANYSGSLSVIVASSPEAGFRATVRGTLGHIEVGEHPGRLFRNGEVQSLRSQDEGHIRSRHVLNWLEGMATRRACACDSELGYRIMVVTGMALEAYYSGEAITSFPS